MRFKIHELPINRKAHSIATNSGLSTAASRNLLHESRTRLSTVPAAPAGAPERTKNDFAVNTLREGLP
jgi:hypothetical protein